MSIKDRLLYFTFQAIKNKDFSFFDRWRAKLVRGLLKSESKNLFVRSGVIIHNFDKLSIGHDVSINHGCFLSCLGGLTIGDYVSIGHNTSIVTTEHSFTDSNKPIKFQPIIEKPVVIGNNVWVGANVTILAGVTVSDGTIIAAGAVVKNNIVEENSIVAGVPAKHIKFHTGNNE